MKIGSFDFMRKTSVLYLTPNLNHYKAKQLNLLSEKLNLTLISGTGRNDSIDNIKSNDFNFEKIQLEVSKKDFGKSRIVRQVIKKHFHNFDWVLVPAEKKNILLFLYLIYLRAKYKNTKLFTHSHPMSKSGGGKTTVVDRIITLFYFNHLDRVIFYTEGSCKWAVSENLIKPEKAFWANNTIDTTEVEKYYQFELPPKHEQRILFIGRLIASKRIDDLIVYYEALQRHLPNLYLDIIGDGPEGVTVNKAIKHNKNIIWHGAIVDEARIAPIMQRASLVLVPGLSGLSINHAFAYGRPYITIAAEKHGPEISYVIHAQNGYVLDGNFEENIEILQNLLEDNEQLAAFCRNAKATGDNLTIDKWVAQMKSSLIDAE